MNLARNVSRISSRRIPHLHKNPPESASVDLGRRVDLKDDEVLEERLKQCLRVSHASEVERKNCLQATTYAFMQGQEWVLRERVDAKHFTEMSQKHFSKVESLCQSHNTPASSLITFLRPVGFLTGVLTAVAPAPAQKAIHGAIQDSILDTYNDQMRTMIEDGTLERNNDIKEAYIELRDECRMPSGATAPPDITLLQRIEELSIVDGIGVVVKGICNLTTKVIKEVKI